MQNQNQNLLLSLVDAEGGKIVEVTVLHDKVFKLQYNDKKIRTGFNYLFIKWSNGPFSPELEEDVEEFIKLGFLKEPKKEDADYILTEKGKHQARLIQANKSDWVSKIRSLRDVNSGKLLAKQELGKVINELHFNYLCLDEAL